MPALLVRKVDEKLIERLKARAAAHGRSAEAEHRAILEAALKPVAAPRTGAELWAALTRGPKVDLELPEDQEASFADFAEGHR